MEEQCFCAGLRELYAAELGRKYSGLKPADAAQHSSHDGTDGTLFTTDEGPVVITTRGKLVFVTESFNLDLARRLTVLVLDAQGSGEMKLAAAPRARRLQQFLRCAVFLRNGREGIRERRDPRHRRILSPQNL